MLPRSYQVCGNCRCDDLVRSIYAGTTCNQQHWGVSIYIYTCFVCVCIHTHLCAWIHTRHIHMCVCVCVYVCVCVCMCVCVCVCVCMCDVCVCVYWCMYRYVSVCIRACKWVYIWQQACKYLCVHAEQGTTLLYLNMQLSALLQRSSAGIAVEGIVRARSSKGIWISWNYLFTVMWCMRIHHDMFTMTYSPWLLTCSLTCSSLICSHWHAHIWHAHHWHTHHWHAHRWHAHHWHVHHWHGHTDMVTLTWSPLTWSHWHGHTDMLTTDIWHAHYWHTHHDMLTTDMLTTDMLTKWHKH